MLLGSTSKIFPSRGIPGGCGIGVLIVMPAASLTCVTRDVVEEQTDVAETKRGGVVASTWPKGAVFSPSDLFGGQGSFPFGICSPDWVHYKWGAAG